MQQNQLSTSSAFQLPIQLYEHKKMVTYKSELEIYSKLLI